MIDKINNNQISDIRTDVSANQPNGRRGPAADVADATLQVRYGALVERAQQTPTDDAKAVERARQLLMSGELDNPENIRKAAENIVKFGV